MSTGGGGGDVSATRLYLGGLPPNGTLSTLALTGSDLAQDTPSVMSLEIPLLGLWILD